MDGPGINMVQKEATQVETSTSSILFVIQEQQERRFDELVAKMDMKLLNRPNPDLYLRN